MPSSLTIRRPCERAIAAFTESQACKPLSYSEVGASAGIPPVGFSVDHRRIQLGSGSIAFDAACNALRKWEMFHLGWVELFWPTAPIAVGQVVCVLVRSYGLWSLNAARIVYVVNETSPISRFGFAYGTLADHAECGEERFVVEMLSDESVWYDLFAFSRPSHWMARIAYPLTRRLQRQFGVDSTAAMVRAVCDGSLGERTP